jgi:hypothetical protein
MGLSCACDHDDYAWYYEVHTKAKPLATKRSHKCCSCKSKIKVGEPAYQINRWRQAREGVEERIFGECSEVYLAKWYFCPDCAAIYHSLEKVNVCFDLGQDDLRDILQDFNKEYAPLPGFRLKVVKAPEV